MFLSDFGAKAFWRGMVLATVSVGFFSAQAADNSIADPDITKSTGPETPVIQPITPSVQTEKDDDTTPKKNTCCPYCTLL